LVGYGKVEPQRFYEGPFSQTVYVIGGSRASAIEIAQHRTQLEPFVKEVSFSQLEQFEKDAFDEEGVHRGLPCRTLKLLTKGGE